ncbi:MAG: hypothetical protein ACKOZW_07405, partial [Cyanobium sp.]
MVLKDALVMGADTLESQRLRAILLARGEVTTRNWQEVGGDHGHPRQECKDRQQRASDQQGS